MANSFFNVEPRTHLTRQVNLGFLVVGLRRAKQCLIREIKEETSLDTETLSITAMTDFVIQPSPDFDKPRHFYLYKTSVPNLNFDVYEGDGAEAYTVSELHQRDDLTSSAAYVLDNVLDENLAVKA